MKLAPGGPLSNRIAEFIREPRAAAKLIEQIARGMNYAHQFGLLHRDLKPANVLLDADRTPLITDFGLAKHLKDDSGLTQSGAILGTPSYMAPEQARGEKQITIAADIYSLGAVLYELLAGRPPFRGETVAQTIRMVEESEPASVRSVNAAVDPELEAIAFMCLEKDPARRYGTAGAMADDLAAWLRGEPVTARRATWGRRMRKWVRRNPAVASLTALAILLLVAGSGVSITYAIRADNRTREAAESELEARKQEATAKDREEVMKDTLCVATFERARAERLAGQSGSKSRSLELLKSAAELRLRTRDPDDHRVAIPEMADLRSEVVMALLARDARLVREFPLDLSTRTHFTENGRFLIWSSIFPGGNSSIELWTTDLMTGHEARHLSVQPTNLKGTDELNLLTSLLALDRQGTRALCPYLGGVAIREFPSGRLITQLPGPKSAPGLPIAEFARFSPDGKRVLAVINDRVNAHAVVWDLAHPDSAQLLAKTPLEKNRFNEFSFFGADSQDFVGLRFSPDGSRVSFASRDRKTVRIVDITQNPPATVKEISLPGELQKLEWHPTLPILGLAVKQPSSQVVAMLWNLKENKPLATCDGEMEATQNRQFVSLSFSPDGRWLAFGGRGSTVRIFGAGWSGAFSSGVRIDRWRVYGPLDAGQRVGDCQRHGECSRLEARIRSRGGCHVPHRRGPTTRIQPGRQVACGLCTNRGPLPADSGRTRRPEKRAHPEARSSRLD